jgi:hypothetical protein
MEGNILSGDCGAVPTQVGTVLSNACPTTPTIVGNILPPCSCSAAIPSAIIDLESDLGMTYAAPLSPPAGSSEMGASADGAGAGYTEGDLVAYRIYSSVGGYFSATYKQYDPFSVNAAPDNGILNAFTAAAGATGYRVFRSVNGGAYDSYIDIFVENFTDTNTGWTAGSTATPVAANQILTWADQSGNSNDCPAEPVEAARGTWVAAVLNGYPAARFDAITKHIVRTAGSSGPGVRTVHCVFKLLAGFVDGEIWNTNFGQFGITGGKFFGKNAAQITGTTSAVAGTHYATFIIDGVNSKLYVDGVLEASGTTGGAATASQILLNYGSGGVQGTAEDLFRFQMYGVAFTDGQRIALEALSRTKYGL